MSKFIIETDKRCINKLFIFRKKNHLKTKHSKQL